MVDIQIAGVMNVNHLGLVAGDALLNLFDQIKPVERIEAVVGQVQQLNSLGTKDGSSFLGRLRKCGEFIAGLIAITLLLAGSGAFGHDQHLHLDTGIGVPGDGAAAAQYFVVWVGGDY